ncbi:Transcription factor 23 [Sarcoptes scabiei]|uniref:Helix-loop-helix DNA-binding domain containing protein 2 n=1 Tax=Sarcoptes scabiei TaxID=52283 RepID=A0A132AFP0_SARSC|nr:Transcription factor 23 [Sarcoptes scabiei]KPM09250.1 Helix-loop-helix DNA-binding domain containing protein 2 [Sarcoptes scabiei]
MSRFYSKNAPTKWITAKNAERERSRVRSLRMAFQSLQLCLPSVPPDTKLSKLDILILATNYIDLLTRVLNQSSDPNPFDTKPIMEENQSISTQVYRPIKKWPMRSRLYSMIRRDFQNDFIESINSNDTISFNHSVISSNDCNNSNNY